MRNELKDHDASHSFDHVERVAKVAVRLAHEEGLDAAAVAVVKLAALLHGACVCLCVVCAWFFVCV